NCPATPPSARPTMPRTLQEGPIMRWRRDALLRCAALALALAPVARAAPGDDIEKEIDAAGPAIAEAQDGQLGLFVEGKVDEACRRIVDSIAEKDRTPGADLAIGNALYDLAPQLSFPCHERAYKARPDSGLTAKEWALELHRAGRYADAEAVYARLP